MVADARTVAVLEGVNGRENLGLIFRNAVVLGSDCAYPLCQCAVQVSMEHALPVPYARATDWPADLVVLRERGFHLLVMAPNHDMCVLLGGNDDGVR